LSIENIKKSFLGKEVLKDINLEIEKGEFLCFLGPSGCGKTTTLRIIAGLESMDEGIISIDGEDVSGLVPGKRDIGIVFQSYALFPNMTVKKNIAYGLINRGIKGNELERKVNEMIKIVHLEGEENKFPTELSGGQQQRVAIARALILEPKILLLDEPLSALDAKVRDSLRLEIKAIQRKLGITTILVTHDQEEAVVLGDRIAVFNGGEIVQLGTPEEIYYNPSDDFVAGFVGKANFVEVDGEKRVLRPECIKYSTKKTFNSMRGTVIALDFRITTYRARVKLENSQEVSIDISWKEMILGNLKIGKNIYVDLNNYLGEYSYAK
ncbi:MAG: ABC transporter ATP-binding protein, partial [Sarcina sp.]